MMKKLISTALLLTPLLFLAQTQAASFSCKTAKLKTEKQVCSHQSLNDADVKLATTYQIILHALPMGGRDAEKETINDHALQAVTQLLQLATEARQGRGVVQGHPICDGLDLLSSA